MKEVWIVEWNGEYSDQNHVFSTSEKAIKHIEKMAQELKLYDTCEWVKDNSEYRFYYKNELVQSVAYQKYFVDID